MINVAISGIPRGYQFQYPDGNWLQDKHRDQILSVSHEIELIELPEQRVHETSMVDGIEVLLAEGGNRTHYPGELDWVDYLKFFTPSLKWVQLCSTGFSDNITPEILDDKVVLTNSPGIHTVPISESVIAAMLHHTKKFDQRHRDQPNKVWRQLKCNDLEGSTVLLIGLGNLGKRVAALSKAFCMKVIGTKKHVEKVANVDIVFPVKQLKQYLPDADYVVELAPLTSETQHLLGESEFQSMSQNCYFINVGRGKVTEESALIKALNEGWISGAYLDCFEVEPLPPDNPLWEMENVFIVPHDSHSSPKIGDRIIEQFCENLRRYIFREPLLNVCDPLRGY